MLQIAKVTSAEPFLIRSGKHTAIRVELAAADGPAIYFSVRGYNSFMDGKADKFGMPEPANAASLIGREFLIRLRPEIRMPGSHHEVVIVQAF